MMDDGITYMGQGKFEEGEVSCEECGLLIESDGPPAMAIMMDSGEPLPHVLIVHVFCAPEDIQRAHYETVRRLTSKYN